MAHPEQVEFCLEVRRRFPGHFHEVFVLDCGSLDVNGNSRFLFTLSRYTGIDLAYGPNVDAVCPIHQWPAPDEFYDTILCIEVLEHDCHWRRSLLNMVRMLRPGGLLLLTCATDRRDPHGVPENDPRSSPFTVGYYENRSEADIVEVLDMNMFSEFEFRRARNDRDLYMWGIKEEEVI